MSGFVISIHAPPRGATGQIYAAISAAMAISIHAPPRGATVSSVPHYFFPVDFNSRPSARGDHRRHKYMQGAQKFQFTPLREGRLEEKSKGDVVGRISIHAPPRGATDSIALPTRLKIFQFTPLREGRHSTLSRLRLLFSRFQFTPLREGRQRCPAQTRIRNGFQFTPLREGRRYTDVEVGLHLNFNSRPSARGDPHCTY